jgi:cysteinyl-tRNA synthetase
MTAPSNKPQFSLYNTLTRKVEPFSAGYGNAVTFYACGPTVYDFAHLGNFRTFLAEDLLRRTLEYRGYKVREVMNITDVGHLTSDADTGEDKLELRARREKKTAWEIAEFYTRAFLKDLDRLNIERPEKLPRATDHVPQMIALIKTLEKKGFTYKLSDGIYFDTSRLKSYGVLSKKSGIKAGARVEMVKGKKNPTDFALWKFSPANSKRQMEWGSPWGKGFPGWHIECSAMSTLYLGQPLDIHAGGVDHIPIHHENEIAQTEAATGKPLSKVFFHAEFMTVDGKRMGKSQGNAYKVDDLIQKYQHKNFDPEIAALAFRLLTLMTHYRTQMDFTWESWQAAYSALFRVRRDLSPHRLTLSKPDYQEVRGKIVESFYNDLDAPGALGLLFKADDYRLWIEFDKILGLNLRPLKIVKLTETQKKLIDDREKARKAGEWGKADEIRKQLAKAGIAVEDSSSGPKIIRTR